MSFLDVQCLNLNLNFCSFMANTLMMKKYSYLLLVLLFISCGSYNSINNFYNLHKNDANVTAIHVPQYMLSLLRGTSGDMNNFLSNVKEIRFIQLQPATENERTSISAQIDGLVSNNFVEVFRKNEDENRTLISLREKRDVVKEIIIFKNNSKNNSIFYLNGNFNPVKVREYVKSNELDNLSNSILQLNNINRVSSEK